LIYLLNLNQLKCLDTIITVISFITIIIFNISFNDFNTSMLVVDTWAWNLNEVMIKNLNHFFLINLEIKTKIENNLFAF